MVPLLKMPGAVFGISIALLWLFIFVESRISDHRPSYGHYIKYGLFIGVMNAVIFYVSHGEIPKFQIGGTTSATNAMNAMNPFPEMF